MTETRRGESTAPTRGDGIVEAVAFAAERLLLSPSWGEAAHEVLARLGTAADVSRTYIVENGTDDDGRLTSTWVAEWTEPGVPRVTDDDRFRTAPWEASGFGRWAEILSAGEVVRGAVSDFPPSEREPLERHGVVSLASLPVFVDGAWWGSIGFDDCRRDREWTAAELDALRAAATVLGAAIQRRRADEQIRATETRYRRFVEHIPAVTYTDVIEDGAARVGFISPQVEALLGYPRERFTSDPDFWFAIVHPEDRARVEEAGSAVTQRGEPFDDEYRMIAADGRVVWVHDTSTEVVDEAGTTLYWQGFLTDITDRRHTEALLRETEQRFRDLVERMPAVTYLETVDPGTTRAEAMRYMSPQVEALLGYPMERWLSDVDFWLAVTHPEDRGRAERAVEVSNETGRPLSEEYRLVAADGRVVWVHEEAVLIRDDDGQPAFWQGFLLDVTDRNEAEEQIRAAEARYRALVEHIPAVVYAEQILEDGNRTFYLSPQALEIFGYDRDDWEGRDFWIDHIHPDDRDAVDTHDRETNRTGDPYAIEYRFLVGDDSYKWIHDEAVLVRDQDGAPRFWQGVFLDVTQRREAEEGLRAAEARFRALVEHLPAVVYTETPDNDPEGFYLSPMVEQVLGYTVHDWTWTPDFWIDRVHPDDRAMVEAADERSNRDLDTFSLDYRFLAGDGSWRWVHDEATFVPDESGPGFWQGFLLDITERKHTEEQLREAELKFRTIVEQSDVVFYTQEIDPDDPSLSNTTYIAPGNTDLVGYSIEDIERDPGLWRKIIHPDDRDRVLATDAVSNTSDEDRFSMEYRMIHKDGRIVWVQDDATKVQLPDRPPYWQGFLLDITERKLAEEQLARALEVEREAARRLRALDEMKNTFLQAVSHDLRTPLAAILGLAITLERGDVQLDVDDAHDLAGRIAENARKLDRLVMNLLDMDRLTRGIVSPNLEPTDVGELVRWLVDESSLIEPARLTVDTEAVVIPIDVAKVERVIENLLANTARHTPANARVWVRVAPMDGGALIAVEDNGVGVPPELRDTIFEPFRQGPEAPQHSPGVGVGLTLVRRFAELHGGRAWVEEREGGGASFRVFLPGSPPAPTD